MSTPNNNARMLANARNWAKANPSDPFAYARGRAHQLSGLVGRNKDGEWIDYQADFRTEERKFQSVITGQEESYTVEVPYNMKRP